MTSESQTLLRKVMARYYVYTFISLKDRKFYTGFTGNLKRRLEEHTRGEVESTANRRPLLLVHYEYFINKDDARASEIFLKSGFSRKQLTASLKRTLVDFQSKLD